MQKAKEVPYMNHTYVFPQADAAEGKEVSHHGMQNDVPKTQE
jgi:hypothetical protein